MTDIQSQAWPSPAKLNLFLHITGRRDDGYHNLQSAFQLIDFGDTLFIGYRDDGQIAFRCDNESLESPDNLVCRAARALLQTAAAQKRISSGVALGAGITLQKRLPMGAGLGGGSSNAATALVALNHLWQLQCTSSELETIALSLGADVPVFVHGASAWAEGVGEILQPLVLPPRWFVVINPAVHISTAELFNDRQLTRDCSPITIRAFQDGEPTHNVFEAVVCRRYPEVQNALTILEEALSACNVPRITGPRMTGTGSSVFVACHTEDMARKVFSGVRERLPQMHCIEANGSEVEATVPCGFVAQGIDQSPLHKSLAQAN